MNKEVFRNKAIATAATLMALGGLAACGESGTPTLSKQPVPSGRKTCDGLPAYRVVGRSKDGDPLLQFQRGENCALSLYNEDTLWDIAGVAVDKSSTFFACYDGDKPERIRATLAFHDHVGATGEINLGDAAATQLATDHDIPPC